MKSADKYDVDYQFKPLGFMQTLYRLRNLTTWVYMAIGLVFTLLYWPEIYQYLPDSWVTWLAAFFDTQLPIRFGRTGM